MTADLLARVRYRSPVSRGCRLRWQYQPTFLFSFSIIGASKAWKVEAMDNTLVSNTWSNTSKSSLNCVFDSIETPAQAIATSTPPHSFIELTGFFNPVFLYQLHRRQWLYANVGECGRREIISSSFSFLLATSPRVAPLAANSFASASLIPLEAPVRKMFIYLISVKAYKTAIKRLFLIVQSGFLQAANGKKPLKVEH